MPFVVRAPLERRADILVQMPVTTAAAYNNWGGKSLYPSSSSDGVEAVKVSFDRPIPAWHDANPTRAGHSSGTSRLIRFLEREGYDVAYTTDLDTHRRTVGAARPSAGHDLGPRRVLERRDARRLRGRRRQRRQHRLHGRQHLLLAGALRGRRADHGRVPQAPARPGARRRAENRPLPRAGAAAAGVRAARHPVPGRARPPGMPPRDYELVESSLSRPLDGGHRVRAPGDASRAWSATSGTGSRRARSPPAPLSSSTTTTRSRTPTPSATRRRRAVWSSHPARCSSAGASTTGGTAMPTSGCSGS